MIAYIKDTDFFSLLGFNKLSEEEQQKYEYRVMSSIINSVLSRLLEDNNIDEERKESLQEFLANPNKDGQLFDSVMEKFPEADRFVDEEIYILKKEMLREMVLEVLNMPGISEDEKSKIEIFSKALDSDSDSTDVVESMSLIYKYVN